MVQKIANVDDLLHKMDTVEGTFSGLYKMILDSKNTLARDNEENERYLVEIQKLGMTTYHYIRAIEEIQESESILLNERIDKYNNESLGLYEFSLLSEKEEILKAEGIFKEYDRIKTSLYSQLILTYNNATILRELIKSNKALDTHLDTILINDIPNIKQQIALCVSIMRQENTIKIIEKVADMFEGIVISNSEALGENLVRLKQLDGIEHRKIEAVLKVFSNIEKYKENIKRVEEELGVKNKQLLDECMGIMDKGVQVAIAGASKQ